jgi:DNA-binding transcriptional ArsR family regulator
MVVDQPPTRDRASRALHALADPTRRDILARALVEDLSVSRLATSYPMSLTAVQKHVTVLEHAGLVHKHRHGREQRVRGDVDSLRIARRALDLLEDAWRGRLDRFGDVLAEVTGADDAGPGSVRRSTTTPTTTPAGTTGLPTTTLSTAGLPTTTLPTTTRENPT